MTDPLPDSLTTAASLRERMVRAAYSLHFVAADVAALLLERDQLLHGPSAHDYPRTSKGWRVMSDEALETARRWETAPADLPHRDHPSMGNVSPPEEIADVLVRRLFGASLRIHTLLPKADEAARETLEETVEALDEAIRGIRLLLLSRAAPPG